MGQNGGRGCPRQPLLVWETEALGFYMVSEKICTENHFVLLWTALTDKQNSASLHGCSRAVKFKISKLFERYPRTNRVSELSGFSQTLHCIAIHQRYLWVWNCEWVNQWSSAATQYCSGEENRRMPMEKFRYTKDTKRNEMIFCHLSVTRM